MSRYPKGSINNVASSKVPTKNNTVPSVSKINTAHSGRIIATATNTTSVPLPPSETSLFTPQVRKWQPFGSDNMFPQAIAQLTRKSPTHRGIIKRKVNYICGKGFDTEIQETEDWINNCNAQEESLHEINARLNYDYFSSGNAYLEIVYDASSNILAFYHRDHTQCRISVDGKSVMIYGNWPMINAANIDNIITIPLYPFFAADKDGSTLQRSIYHYKDYEPEFNYYGTPSWVAAMDAAAIAYKTNKWNVSRLDNDFAGSGVLTVEGDISPKEGKEMKKDFKETFIGEGKTGKVMFVVKQLGGGKTEFTQTNKVSEGDWLALHKQSTEDLIIAHEWFPSLSGIVGTGGLNGVSIQQIRVEYSMALDNIILPMQKKFLDIYKKIIAKTSKIDFSDVVAVNNPPVDMFDVDVNSIITVGEARVMKGLPYLEDDETMDIYVSQNKTNTAVKDSSTSPDTTTGLDNTNNNNNG